MSSSSRLRHAQPASPVYFAYPALSEEACCAAERLNADGQLDLRRLLHVAHPLAIHVGGSDIARIVGMQIAQKRKIYSNGSTPEDSLVSKLDG